MKQQKLTSHEFYLGIIAEICQEMGYEIIDKKYDSMIDLQVRNPKNGREAIIELETTFQRQKQQHQKYAKRYKLIRRLRQKNKDVILLAFGIRRYQFENLFRLEGMEDEFKKEYGKTLFTCPVFDDPTWTRSILIRCLGDE